MWRNWITIKSNPPAALPTRHPSVVLPHISPSRRNRKGAALCRPALSATLFQTGCCCRVSPPPLLHGASIKTCCLFRKNLAAAADDAAEQRRRWQQPTFCSCQNSSASLFAPPWLIVVTHFWRLFYPLLCHIVSLLDYHKLSIASSTLLTIASKHSSNCSFHLVVSSFQSIL